LLCQIGSRICRIRFVYLERQRANHRLDLIAERGTPVSAELVASLAGLLRGDIATSRFAEGDGACLGNDGRSAHRIATPS
jgi:hypothetical protein